MLDNQQIFHSFLKTYKANANDGYTKFHRQIHFQPNISLDDIHFD